MVVTCVSFSAVTYILLVHGGLGSEVEGSFGGDQSKCILPRSSLLYYTTGKEKYTLVLCIALYKMRMHGFSFVQAWEGMLNL